MGTCQKHLETTLRKLALAKSEKKNLIEGMIK